MARLTYLVCLLATLGCASPAPMPPRVAEALGGRPRGCTIACSIGTYCDSETGACIGGGSSTSTQSTSTTSSPSRAIELPEGGLAFACTTVTGLDDDIVASDGEAATRACETMNGEPCTCVPASLAAREP